MKLVSSGPALDLVLALTQLRGGARLAELATASKIALSSAQTAMRLLLSDRVVSREGGPRPRYRLRDDHRASDAIVQMAARYAAAPHSLDLVLRANPAIEFAARDRDGYIAVEHPLADPRDLAALEHVAALIGAGGDGPRMTRFTHHDLLDRLRDDPGPLRRAEAATRLKGSLARSFSGPISRSRGSKATGRSRRVRVPARALARIARAHQLRRVQLFGSGARGALGPTSDLDVLVEPRPDAPLSLLDLARLEAELEALFDRHVDIATTGSLRSDARERIEGEAVTLFGRS